MSDKNDDLEVHVVDDDVVPNDTIVEVVDTPKGKPVTEIDAQDGIKELNRRLEAERRSRIEAEARAREASEQAYRAKAEADDTNLHFVTNVIDTVRRENDILKANYRDAMSVGDYDRASDIQMSMSDNAARLLQLENGKSAMETKPKQQMQQYQPSDPVDALISQVTGPSASWLDKNRDNLRNPKTIDRMFRAHADAVDDGIIPDSDDYFQYIENRIGINRDNSDTDSAMSSASAPSQRRASPAAAPVSRSGTGTGSRPNVVRLSKEEAEVAKMNGMTEKEYALNKIALQKSGRLS